jgi:hypothetical protein
MKTPLPLVVFFLICICSNAQLPDFSWKLVLRGNNTAWLADLVVDNNGNSYAAVNFTAPIKIPGLEKQNFGYPGHVNGLIIKINKAGKPQWAHPFKSGFDNRINDIALAPGGDLLITGFGDGVMQFPGLKDTLKLGKAKAPDYYRYNQGFYVARYAPDGERKWVQYYDSPWGEGISVAVNSRNIISFSFYFTGTMKQHGAIIDSVPDRKTEYRHCLAELEGHSGKLVDFRTMQDQPSGAGVSMKAKLLYDAADNLLVYGYFNRRINITATDSLTNDGYYEGSDSYIAKLDIQGKLLWAKKIGGQSSQSLADIDIAADNSVYATGYYNYECLLSDGASVIQKSKYEYKSGYSFFYLHLFEDGEADFIRYEDSKGYSSYFNGENLALDNAGNTHLVGYFTDTLRVDGHEAATNNVYSGFCSEWNGAELKQIGRVGATSNRGIMTRHIDIRNNVYAIGGAFDNDSAILQTITGRRVPVSGTEFGSVFIVGGRLQTADKTGIKEIAVKDVRQQRVELVQSITACTTTKEPAADVWLPVNKDKTGPPCGNEVRGMAVTLFPNPTRGEVKVKLTGITGTAQLEIFSNKGELILSNRLQDAFDGQVVTLDLSVLADATYIVRITHKNFQKGLMVVKMR